MINMVGPLSTHFGTLTLFALIENYAAK